MSHNLAFSHTLKTKVNLIVTKGQGNINLPSKNVYVILPTLHVFESFPKIRINLLTP